MNLQTTQVFSHQHPILLQRQGCETLIEAESVAVDFQPTATNFLNSKCDIDNDEHQALDDYFNADDPLNCSESVAN